jgi:hypothetical protein
MRTLALLVAAAIGVPVVAAAAAPQHQQLLNGPRSAQVRYTLHGRVVTTTLGRLQDQHKAIAASFAHAAQQGAAAASKLDRSSPVAVGAPGTHPTTPPNLVIRGADSTRRSNARETASCRCART